MLQIKRVYDAPSAKDGYRVLVDRLWPRGLKRGAAHVSLWLKDIAPSDELWRWFGHDPARWETFAARYRKELMAGADLGGFCKTCAEAPGDAALRRERPGAQPRVADLTLVEH